MEPRVVDSNPAIVEIIENVGVMSAKSNVGMIVRPPCMDSLGRNDIVSGHHNHKRYPYGADGVRIEPVKRAFFVEDMVERPAQRQRRVFVSQQRQLIESSLGLAFLADDVTKQPELCVGVTDDVMAFVDKANHQGRLALII